MLYRISILDENGNVLEESEPKTREEIVEAANMIFEMLEKVPDANHVIIYRM